MTELLDLIKEPKLKELMENAKSETKFDDIIDELNKLNPWKVSGNQEIKREVFVKNLESYFSEKKEELKYLLWELPGIADKDKDVFIPLLVDNIMENIEKVIPDDKINTGDAIYKKVLIALMICLPFMDYQQAFDGNLYDPRVIILGINPRFKADTFYDYERKKEKKTMVEHMRAVYENPIHDENCSMLYKVNETDDKNGEKIEPTDLHIAEDDYYYGRCGHFYSNISDNLKEEHRSRCLGNEEKQDNDEKQNNEGKTDTKKRNPVAFLELFPYASKGIGTWWGREDLNHALTLLKLLKWEEGVYNALKTWAIGNMNRISPISIEIKKKIRLESDELLYSQQWILCLLYCILIENSSWFVISTRHAGDHLKRLEAFINTALNFEKNPSFCFLTTNSQNRSLGPNNLVVVENGVKGIKINELNAHCFWNTSDTSASQNATGSTKDQKNETLNDLAFRHLWGINEEEKVK